MTRYMSVKSVYQKHKFFHKNCNNKNSLNEKQYIFEENITLRSGCMLIYSAKSPQVCLKTNQYGFNNIWLWLVLSKISLKYYWYLFINIINKNYFKYSATCGFKPTNQFFNIVADILANHLRSDIGTQRLRGAYNS